MGSLRFRKQFKIAPGVKFNVNKKSVGLTLGGRGAHLTYNTRGQRTTSVGLPGTGLWYRDTKTFGSRRTRAVPSARVSRATNLPPLAPASTVPPLPPLSVTGLDENLQRQAIEAEKFVNAHVQQENDLLQWMSQMYAWAGTDPARSRQAHELILARGRAWVQSAKDMGQRNRFVQAYADSLSIDFDALADQARQTDALLEGRRALPSTTATILLVGAAFIVVIVLLSLLV
ncbi:DUF4236 domain-containing protein [Mycobacterium seoulense]|uniref:DUF4236 domain-containing protein n=1 Tax=Mycobacterium seoulense TaxID=386911 RepID=UPI003CE6E2A2